MAHVALARKWRSSQFSDLVGQAPAVRTFMNAIRKNKLHHAYLLTGSRGIGKTSIARIIAKAVRCPNLKDENGFLVSCDTCSSCLEITQCRSPDVLEIDGASNNGVDSVREIRDSALYLPQFGSKKIYIIDEVHMLSTAAFNALLKTLEEPPEHVIFLFATTEPHKIPNTILSRCQRFDLKKISSQDISERLKYICAAENMPCEVEALHHIARIAEGSMRDALSILEQSAAYGDGEVELTSVELSTGWVRFSTVLDLIQNIFQRNSTAAVTQLNALQESGQDLKLVARLILEALRGLLLIKISKAPALSMGLDLSPADEVKIREVSALRTLEEIEIFFHLFEQHYESICKSPFPRWIIDVLLVECSETKLFISTNPTLTPPPLSPPPAEPPVQKLEKKTLRDFMSRGTDPQPAAPTIAKLTQKLDPPTKWEDLIELVRKLKPMLAATLENGMPQEPWQPLELEWTVYFAKEKIDFYSEQLFSKPFKDSWNTVCTEVFGGPKRLLLREQEQVNSIAFRRQQTHHLSEQNLEQSFLQHPVLLEARRMLGGELGPLIKRTST